MFKLIKFTTTLFCLTLSLFSFAQELQLHDYSSKTFTSPIDIANAGDDRMFVVEKEGKIFIVKSDGSSPSTPFLDISGRVNNNNAGNQRGLLGLDFHPDYSTNGRFYVYYVDDKLMTYISEFTVTADPDVADASSEVKLLSFSQPSTNNGDDHKGGGVKFGKDGYLYVTSGDGGKGTNGSNVQDLSKYLGKLIRLDVPGDGTSSFPADNPFVNDANALDGIYAYGLRNPWTLSFDKQTGDMYIGDVGANRWDEINVHAFGAAGGVNYGWPCFEADEVWEDLPSGQNCPEMSETVLPVLTVFQPAASLKITITGGFVYRGSVTPYFNGKFIYAEAYSGEIFVGTNDNGTWTGESILDSDFFIYSFGQDNTGELYLSAPGSKLQKLKLISPDGAQDILLSKNTATVTEGGQTATVDITLNAEPSGNVVLKVVSDTESEVTVSPATLTFNASNYDSPQTVTITGVDDADIDGDQDAQVTISVDVNQSEDYKQSSSLTITVTNEDNDALSNNPIDLVTVYPNPAKGKFQIKGMQKGWKVNITDLSGKQVNWKSSAIDEGVISISGLNQGIYMVQVLNSADNITRAHRLIVQ